VDSDFNEVWLEYAERIRTANEQFAEKRQRYFVDLYEETIGDFPAIVLTLERYLLISLSGVFTEDTGDDGRIPVLRFLWFVSPDFSTSPKKAKRFLRKHGNIDAQRYLPLIKEYIQKSFEFANTGAKKQSGGGSTGSTSDWASTVIDQLAHNYHWKEKDILRMSLPRIFLYLEKIKQRNTGQTMYSCKEADELKHEFMQTVNNRNNRN
jgi:hypothetical protein